MKKELVLFTILLLFNVTLASAQDEPSDFTGRDLRQRENAAQTDRFNFVPNEIIVRFKDEVQLKSGSQLKSTGISGIDQVLKSAQIENIEPLFPNAERLKSSRIVKTPLGQDMVIPSLHNIYKITLPQLKSNQPQEENIHEYIQQLEEQPEVEYAEPNYIYTIGDFEAAGEEMTMLEALERPANYNISQTASGLIPNDPLYNSQWGIPACNIDDVWNTTTGDSTSIIAIMDTGVDKDHLDLKKNIWENDGEIPGNGQDDDGNGKVDDTWGWDFINNDNEPYDDNSHGTHCAGIAAAVGDNGIGIAGVNWKARIMSVKVFQSSGQGDAATIAQGITYAAEKGATVISMSFGSYAKSLAMQDALANAYANAVLVAAAGNDALCIGPGYCPDMRLGAPLFPGAFSFVLGVEANGNTTRAGFSNYDQDGPVFSNYSDLLNYELKAPGAGILSSIPGGNYREYSGTSMATPLVAGAVSLYREQKPEESQELLFGNMIHSIGQHIDLQEALNIIPEPVLDIVSYEVIDTIDGDADGRADAGETIELKVTVRNTWGQANNVKVGIDFAEFEDHSVATIEIDSAVIGSLSAYASLINVTPLKIKIGKDVADGRDIVFDLKTWYGDHLGETFLKTKISVESGIELKGVLSEDLTLYPDKQYIVTENLAVPENITLIIKPGTTVKFDENKTFLIAGNVIAIGTPDSLITFTKMDSGNSWKGIIITETGNIQFEYGRISYGGIENNRTAYLIDDNNISNNNSFFSNILFTYNYGIVANIKSKLINSCFTKNLYGIMGMIWDPRYEMYNNTFINNHAIGYDSNYGALCFSQFNPDYFKYNCIFGNINGENIEINIEHTNHIFEVFKLPPNYYGTTNLNKINAGIIDFEEVGSLPFYDVSNKMTSPPLENHGIVWKLLINGVDSQDEFDLLDPIGVGKHKFEVYFNRAMDTTITPQISMGVRYPYTQTSISEDGGWNADSSIYTTYLDVGHRIDNGINTLRVSGAQDPDHFEIPIEDRRFHVTVDVTGSLSNGFAAIPGAGKVGLEWESPSEGVEDLLGYTMYRYTYINDSITSDTVKISQNLITDTVYTDLNVIPGTKYYYCYKLLRTNFDESGFSKVVAATPLTATKGDANGDLIIDESDVISTIDFISGNSTEEFIFEAGDINTDEVIDIRDVVSIINIILGTDPESESDQSQEVKISVEDGIVYVDTPVELAGIQFILADVDLEQDIETLEALDSFEAIRRMKDGKMFFLAYSLSGKTIPVGKTAILKLNNTEGWIFEALLSDRSGKMIDYSLKEDVTLYEYRKLNAGFSLGQNYPNPFTGLTTISYELDMEVQKATITIFDIHGRLVHQWIVDQPIAGLHKIEWHSQATSGFFLYNMSVQKNEKISTSETKKMLIR